MLDTPTRDRRYAAQLPSSLDWHLCEEAPTAATGTWPELVQVHDLVTGAPAHGGYRSEAVGTLDGPTGSAALGWCAAFCSGVMMFAQPTLQHPDQRRFDTCSMTNLALSHQPWAWTSPTGEHHRTCIDTEAVRRVTRGVKPAVALAGWHRDHLDAPLEMAHTAGLAVVETARIVGGQQATFAAAAIDATLGDLYDPADVLAEYTAAGLSADQLAAITSGLAGHWATPLVELAHRRDLARPELNTNPAAAWVLCGLVLGYDPSCTAAIIRSDEHHLGWRPLDAGTAQMLDYWAMMTLLRASDTWPTSTLP